MKEILFKAKRIDNGEWVEGDLTHNPYQTIHINGYIVKSNTVSRYIGREDKNGNKVFLNDKVKGWGEEIGYIGWNENTCSYQIKGIPSRTIRNIDEYEVIGNIFDDAPYSTSEYNEAKEKGLDLDNWSDYEEYFGLGEKEELE